MRTFGITIEFLFTNVIIVLFYYMLRKSLVLPKCIAIV